MLIHEQVQYQALGGRALRLPVHPSSAPNEDQESLCGNTRAQPSTEEVQTASISIEA
jgi:hypothetical protein